jgi:hypothetical protein
MGKVAHIAKENIANRILVGKHYGKKSLGGLKHYRIT